MATPFFGKRDAENPIPSTGLRSNTNGVQQSYGAASVLQSVPVAPNVTPVQTSAKPAEQAVTASAAPEGGSKLTVGPNIKLKGVEITDCDTLVVEGFVEATMDSRVMQIAEQGAFKGSAEIDVAEIRGEFTGNLTVRQKLVIYSTGKVTGTIRYGKLVIEEGGQLAGEILFGTAGKPPALPHAGVLVKTA